MTCNYTAHKTAQDLLAQETISIAEWRAFINTHRRWCDDDAFVKNEVMECFNCFEVDLDDGDIWIANPQSGHWLSEDERIQFLEFLDVR